MGVVMNQNNGHLEEPQPISIISWDDTKLFLFPFFFGKDDTREFLEDQ